MKREYVVSGPCRGGLKPKPTTPKPNIKIKGQGPVKVRLGSAHNT